jgi:small-conductance mechanosensitive channel
MRYEDVLIAIAILLISLFIAKIFFFIFKKYIKKFAEKTKTKLDDLLLAALEKPIYFAIILAGAYFALLSINLLSPYESWIRTIFAILGIILGLFVATRLVNVFITWYMSRKKIKRVYKTAFLSIRNIISVIIYVIAFILILNTLGVEITALVAGLGIGGLAVALALQSTLANYLAGLYVMTDRSIKIGDYIELEGGLKGYIEKVGWRSAKMRTIHNNLVVIPNSKLADMVVTNFYDPVKEMAVILQCGVAYDSDLEKVEKVTIDVAKKVLKDTKGGTKDFDPFIRYHTFGDSNIQFSIILRVNEFTDQYLVKHRFIKELMKAYKKERIEISYPVTNIYMRK